MTRKGGVMDRREFLKTGGAIGLGAAAAVGVPGGASGQVPPDAAGKYKGEMIDVFCHIIPPRFKEALFKKSRPTWYIENTKTLPALWDLGLRFKAMDRYEGMRQLLTLGMPPIEYAAPKDAVDLARLANDEMAELVGRHPDRFVGAVAGLPMNDVDAALRETERAIGELKLKGVQLASSPVDPWHCEAH